MFGKPGVELMTGGVTVGLGVTTAGGVIGVDGTLITGEDAAATVTVAVQLAEPAPILVAVPVYVVVTDGVMD